MLPSRPVQEVEEPQALSGQFGIAVEGMSDIMVRMAKCCKPIPGDEIVGYISLGKGITIHRKDCKNARALMKNPERFTKVGWKGLGGMAFRVEIMIEALDRNHLLEDVARTLSDSGVNIIGGSVQTLPDGVVRDRFTLEVGDVRQLDNILANIRSIQTVYDAYRVVGG
jgi:GTP pyrophosphokinase